MEGGGAAAGEGFKLGDIGDYRDGTDFYPIGLAAIFGMNLSVIVAKVGGLGGTSLNTFFDAFGLEGLLANASLVVILMQIARWLYTTFYNTAGSKPWSPFIFVCILLVVQLLHDLIFYYGIINVLPSGKNEMIDVLKEYSAEHGRTAIGGHEVLLIIIAALAMVFKEVSMLSRMIIIASIFYMVPYMLTMVRPRVAAKPTVQAPPAEAAVPKVPQQEPKPERLGARDMYQDMNWSLR
jgi:hypothetical protein